MVVIFFSFQAYSGVNGVINIVEEIKPPLKRNIVVSIIISKSIITGVYLLTNFAYLAVLTPSEILSSDAVAMTFGARYGRGVNR